MKIDRAPTDDLHRLSATRPGWVVEHHENGELYYVVAVSEDAQAGPVALVRLDDDYLLPPGDTRAIAAEGAIFVRREAAMMVRTRTEVPE